MENYCYHIVESYGYCPSELKMALQLKNNKVITKFVYGDNGFAINYVVRFGRATIT